MLFDLFTNDAIITSKKSYEKLKRRTENFLITPIKVMSLLIAISGLFAMMFEVRYFTQFSFEVYLTRLLATVIAFSILVASNSSFAQKKPVLLVHVLLITIILSSAYMIYLIPSTLITNSQIVGLMIFTSALFLSWEVKNQIIVAIYYNMVFAFVIITNDKSIYFLPNMYESVLFVLFLSILSVVGSAVNFRLRLQAAKNASKVATSERKFRSIFNHSAEGIFQSTLDGKFIITNPSMARILGYENAAELRNVNIANDIFKSPEDREKLINLVIKKGFVENYQITLKKKNGEDVVVKLNDRIFYDEEENISYLEGSITDITQQIIIEEKKKTAEKELREEKKRTDMLADEAIQLSVSKSKFLAHLGHEIRTPVNGIIGYLSLIENNYYETAEEMREFVSNAKGSAESLIELLNSILDLSKIESGRMELYEVDFNLNDLIEHAISINMSKIREKGLYISKEVDSKIPQTLRGDATRIRQIFVNLISNAIKFTEKGKIEIYSRLESISENSFEIMSSVRDTGIGIPEDKFDKLFKPFSQTDASHSSKYGGTGLGLMICKQFVNMMGGDISVESKINAGSTFYFNIKLHAKKHEMVAQNNHSSFEEFDIKKYERESHSPFDGDLKIRRSRFNILLAEDNVVNQKVMLRMLSELGYKADAVSSGKDAISKIDNESYHLVLMDIQMPEMDGLTATKYIREFDEPKRNIPIVAITAHALNGDKEKCLEAGANDYLTKPVNVKQLASVLDSWLNVEIGLKEKNESEIKSEDGVFDYQRFVEMSLGDVEFQRELLMDYFEDLEQRLFNLNVLLQNKNLDEIIKEAHTIKGSSFSVGAVRIGEEALGIELSGKSNDWESTSDRLQTLKSAFVVTKETVKHLL